MWIWVSAAFGGSDEVTEPVFAEIVSQLTPTVVEVAGRYLPEPVRTAIVSRADLVEIVSRPAPAFPGRAGAQPGPAPVAAWRAEQLGALERAVAAHVPHLNQIFLIREALDEISDQVPAEALVPVVRCIAAHELVHALQHGYSDTTGVTELDAHRGRRALLEGHATLVGLRLCASSEGDAIARTVASVLGLHTAPTAAPDDPIQSYAYGRVLAERLEAEEGQERLWSALTAPPPSWEALAAEVRPFVAGGWDDPQPVSDALARLGRAGAVPEPRTLAALGRLLPGGEEVLDAPGWLVRSEDDREVLGVFRLAPGVPAELVQRRRVAFRGHNLALLGAIPGSIRKVRVVPRRPDDRVSAGIRGLVFGSTGVRYVEHWTATDRTLVVHAVRSPKLGLGAIEQALVSLGVAMPVVPGGPPPLAALAPWFDQVRAVPPLTIPGVDWRLERAILAANAGSKRPCAAFDDVLAAAENTMPLPLQEAAYRCGVMAADLATADPAAAWFVLVDPELAADHAALLLQARRPEDALAVLDRADPTPGPATPALADLRLEALAQAARFDALAEVALGAGSPEARVGAGEFLLGAGRASEGAAIIAAVCGGVPPVPDACRRHLSGGP